MAPWEGSWRKSASHHVRKFPGAPGLTLAAREGRSSEAGTPPKVPGDGLDEQISAFPRTAPEAILELENDSRNTSEKLWEDSEEFLENLEK